VEGKEGGDGDGGGGVTGAHVVGSKQCQEELIGLGVEVVRCVVYVHP
jgi:hypothetical protein